MKSSNTVKTSLARLFLTSYIIVSIMVAGCRETTRQPAVQASADSLFVPSTAAAVPVEADGSLPVILISPGNLKPYTLRDEMIGLPDSLQRNKFRILNGVKANITWLGIVPLEEGDFECYTFSLIKKTDTLLRVDSVFKVWLPEAGGDWISIQLKKEVAETNSPGTVYLVNTVSHETFLVDEEVHNATNAPVVKVGSTFYVFYVKDDKVYRYSIAEKKTAAITVLRYQDADSENVEPHKLELQQTGTGLTARLVIQYKGKYYFIPFPILS